MAARFAEQQRDAAPPPSTPAPSTRAALPRGGDVVEVVATPQAVALAGLGDVISFGGGGDV